MTGPAIELVTCGCPSIVKWTLGVIGKKNVSVWQTSYFWVRIVYSDKGDDEEGRLAEDLVGVQGWYTSLTHLDG